MPDKMHCTRSINKGCDIIGNKTEICVLLQVFNFINGFGNRLSSKTTVCPSMSSLSERCDPQSPAPPVTTDVVCSLIMLVPSESNDDEVIPFTIHS